MKKIYMVLAVCLFGIAGFSQTASTGIDLYADEVSNDDSLRSIYWCTNDTLVFKLQNVVEINGHYYNGGGEFECEFQLVFVLNGVFIRDCEGTAYRSVKRCGRKSCEVIHLDCISEGEPIDKQSVDLQKVVTQKSTNK